MQLNREQITELLAESERIVAHDVLRLAKAQEYLAKLPVKSAEFEAQCGIVLGIEEDLLMHQMDRDFYQRALKEITK